MEVWGEIWEVRGVGSGWDWVSGGGGREGMRERGWKGVDILLRFIRL